jgi:hypothetical protein
MRAPVRSIGKKVDPVLESLNGEAARRAVGRGPWLCCGERAAESESVGCALIGATNPLATPAAHASSSSNISAGSALQRQPMGTRLRVVAVGIGGRLMAPH